MRARLRPVGLRHQFSTRSTRRSSFRWFARIERASRERGGVVGQQAIERRGKPLLAASACSRGSGARSQRV
jgi:hypothetical protein